MTHQFDSLQRLHLGLNEDTGVKEIHVQTPRNAAIFAAEHWLGKRVQMAAITYSGGNRVSLSDFNTDKVGAIQATDKGVLVIINDEATGSQDIALSFAGDFSVFKGENYGNQAYIIDNNPDKTTDKVMFMMVMAE